MCGEKRGLILRITGYKGSPPHVRGKDRVELHRGLFGGITPACAGKSARPTPASTAWSDHPPRMRGKALENGGGSLDVRITPACAGKSHFATNFHLNKRNHPRMCGEKTKKIP